MGFSIGIPELMLICGIVLIFGFITWVSARVATRRRNPPLSDSTIIDVVDSSPTGRLKELNRLLENNLITQAEYDAKKAEIMNQL
jgi:hypothetical protein